MLERKRRGCLNFGKMKCINLVHIRKLLEIHSVVSQVLKKYAVSKLASTVSLTRLIKRPRLNLVYHAQAQFGILHYLLGGLICLRKPMI